MRTTRQASFYVFLSFVCAALPPSAYLHGAALKGSRPDVADDPPSAAPVPGSRRTLQGVGSQGLTYSVIVVRSNVHNANLFAEQARVRAYSEGVVSVQFAHPRPTTLLDETPGRVPFGVAHTEGVDRRVRIIHTWDVLYNHKEMVTPTLDEKLVSTVRGGEWGGGWEEMKLGARARRTVRSAGRFVGTCLDPLGATVPYWSPSGEEHERLDST